MTRPAATPLPPRGRCGDHDRSGGGGRADPRSEARSPRPPRGDAARCSSVVARRLEGAAATLDLRAPRPAAGSASRFRAMRDPMPRRSSPSPRRAWRYPRRWSCACATRCISAPCSPRPPAVGAPRWSGRLPAASVRPRPSGRRAARRADPGEGVDVPDRRDPGPPGARAPNSGGETGRRAARFAAGVAPGWREVRRRPTGRLLGAEGGQALPGRAGGRRAGRVARPDPGGDRGRRNREGAAAAGRRSRCALRRALDAG